MVLNWSLTADFLKKECRPFFFWLYSRDKGIQVWPWVGSAHVVVKVLQDIKDLKDTGPTDDAEFVRLKAAALASL